MLTVLCSIWNRSITVWSIKSCFYLKNLEEFA